MDLSKAQCLALADLEGDSDVTVAGGAYRKPSLHDDGKCRICRGVDMISNSHYCLTDDDDVLAITRDELKTARMKLAIIESLCKRSRNIFARTLARGILKIIGD